MKLCLMQSLNLLPEKQALMVLDFLKNPIKITDHEGSVNVIHTPSFEVSNGIDDFKYLKMKSAKMIFKKLLNLESGAKGLVIEVELGTLPSTAQTIEFKGILIDGADSTPDTGERVNSI